MQAVFAPVPLVFGRAGPTVEGPTAAPPIEEPTAAVPIEEPMCAVAWAPLPLVPPPSVRQDTMARRNADITRIRPATKLAR